MKDVPVTRAVFRVSEIIKEDYNCNVRRYVDNAPPPEPHDVRAHFMADCPSLRSMPSNISGKTTAAFESVVSCPAAVMRYMLIFSPAVTSRQALTELVKDDPSVVKAHARFLETLEAWWIKNLPLIKALAPSDRKRGNVYALRRALLSNISNTFASQDLLSEHQIRGALAKLHADI